MRIFRSEAELDSYLLLQEWARLSKPKPTGWKHANVGAEMSGN